jgi:hypothetical protein
MVLFRRLTQLVILLGLVFVLTDSRLYGAQPSSRDVTCEEAWFDEGWVTAGGCECGAFGCLDCIEFDLHEPHCPSEECTRNDFCSLAADVCDYYCQFEANGTGGLIPVFNGCFMGSECNYVCGCGTAEPAEPAGPTSSQR